MVCKAFQAVLPAIPMHVTVSTPGHVRSIASLPFRSWKVATVQHNLSAVSLDAACKLPDRERKKIVAAEVSGNSVPGLIDRLQQMQPEGLCHMIIKHIAGSKLCDHLNILECLSHIERLDLLDVSHYTFQLKVLLLLPMRDTCMVFCPTPDQECRFPDKKLRQLSSSSHCTCRSG